MHVVKNEANPVTRQLGDPNFLDGATQELYFKQELYPKGLKNGQADGVITSPLVALE